MKKINQTNLKRRISLMLLITIFLMSSLVVGCGKKNVGTPEDNAVVEEDDKKNDNTEEGGRLFGFSGIDMSNPFYDTLKKAGMDPIVLPPVRFN